MSKGEAKRKAAACEAPLGFEPRISCLQDRRFDQLSHGAPSLQRVSPGQLSSAAAEGWFASQPAHCTAQDRRFNQLSHGAIPHGLGGEDVSEDQSIQRRGAARLKRVGPTAGPRMQAPRGFWKDRPSGLCAVEVWFEKHCRGPMSKGEAKRKAAACEAPLGFEPRISCLQDRRFDQLSHGAPSLRRVSPGQLSSAAAEGWFASQPAHCTAQGPVCVLFSERKATLPKEVPELPQRHCWDSNPGSPVY
ncbi:hypothetical protein Q8A67_018579 [Cirrhinus molitorella]|uniref:Uncharacterized protein n=1 Tax=Cirrhinus molitorella TaxID=172907 RepID=A0AA88TEW2_9TELE|nr:hypothetical protein Q8A67_018574 [Cirrhinus molitorella]KAK2881311.1 hypothetical protein Q8A67_018579 [Cirrhinus molitorella]